MNKKQLQPKEDIKFVPLSSQNWWLFHTNSTWIKIYSATLSVNLPSYAIHVSIERDTASHTYNFVPNILITHKWNIWGLLSLVFEQLKSSLRSVPTRLAPLIFRKTLSSQLLAGLYCLSPGESTGKMSKQASKQTKHFVKGHKLECSIE